MKLKFNINLNVVKSKNNLEIARRYHHYDNVESMYITLKDDLYHIDAVVSVFNHIQKCSLEIKDNKVVSYKCACPFNDQDSMCGHLGAVIMKLNELEINDFPFEYQSEKLEKMKEIEKENQRQRRKAQLRQLAHTSSRLIVINENPNMFCSIDRIREELRNLLTDKGIFKIKRVLEYGTNINLDFETTNFSISKILQNLLIESIIKKIINMENL